MRLVLVKKSVLMDSKGRGLPLPLTVVTWNEARLAQAVASMAGASSGGEVRGELLMKIGDVSAETIMAVTTLKQNVKKSCFIRLAKEKGPICRYGPVPRTRLCI